MNDKELLVAAARAADIKGSHSYFSVEIGWRFVTNSGASWNPLTDDGDALRLAVSLNINIVPNYYAEWHRPDGSAGRAFTVEAEHDASPCEATRRAIVRAAAEIGSLHNAKLTG